MPRPDFFVIGAPKCGTTSLCAQLAAHPEIFLAPVDPEPNHFVADEPLATRFALADEAEYLRLFDAAPVGVRRVGERTVSYLYPERTPGRVRCFAPEARAIVMLRRPVDQMHSLHWTNVRALNEDLLDFAEALRAEPDRAAGRRIPDTAARPFTLRYRLVARTAEPLARWIDVLGRERVHVVIFDDFVVDPVGTARDVFAFLDVSPDIVPAVVSANRSEPAAGLAWRRLVVRRPWIRRLARSVVPAPARAAAAGAVGRLATRERPPVPVDLRARLVEEFEPEVRRLESLLDRDLSAWRTVSDFAGEDGTS